MSSPSADLEDAKCEFCGEPANLRLEFKKKAKFGLVGLARHMFVCWGCEDKGRRMTRDEKDE